MKIKSKFPFIIPILLFSAAIFWASNQEQPVVMVPGFDFGDKLMHFLAYFLYGLVLLFGLKGYFWQASNKKIKIISLIIGSLYALSDEIHQYYIPGRSAEVADWVANFAGLVVSLLMFSFITRIIAFFKSEDEQFV